MMIDRETVLRVTSASGVDIPEKGVLLGQWRHKTAAGQHIRGVAAGSALDASRAERDGVDFIVVNNTGKFQRSGFGIVASLMPYDDANAAVLAAAPRVMPEVRRTPVFAGLCGVDPFRMPRTMILDAAKAGYAGVQNFPSVGFFDGRFRRQIERSGLGFGLEVEMVRLACELGLMGVPLVFTREEALDMARAGADALVFHRGLAVPGECVPAEENARAYHEAFAPVLDIRPETILLNQDAGPAGNEAFLAALADKTACHGFFADGEPE